MSLLRIIVSGSKGKVGRPIVEAVEQAQDMTLVGQVDRQDDLRAVIQSSQPDIVIDFTSPDAAFKNASTIIDENVHPVVGTTGFTKEQISELTQRCAEKKLGGLIAPNFSISAVLMMQYAQETARYLKDVEILEMHHSDKKDAPSGTALKTAEMIAVHRGAAADPFSDSHKEGFSHTLSSDHPARGMHHAGVPIHSIRLPGLIAHQAVIFSGKGETLTLRQDTMSRESFVPGVLLACRQVKTLTTLLYGLELLLPTCARSSAG